MQDVLLEIRGLRVKNDGKKTARQFALDIDHLEIRPFDCILVLADRGHGKSALKDSLKAIFSQPLAERNNLDIPQGKESKPPVHIDSLLRAGNVCFHEKDGDPAGLQTIKDHSTIIYCDDPLFPYTPDSSSREMIDIIRERSLTMMITSDPDRIQRTLEHLLNSQTSRILWLLNGRIFWNGQAGEFCNSIDALCNQYQSEWKEGPDTEGFLKKIRFATQKLT